MPFVATPAQVEAFKRICCQPSYTQETIVVEFHTTTEFIQGVLPPHLEPAVDPVGLINIGNWQSNACGDFELASVAVRCRSGDREGYYALTLIVSEPFAITWGRESWGEVKKPGKPRLFSSGSHKYAYCERNGVRLIELEGEFGEWLEPEDSEWYSFEVKAFPAASGGGLHGDPVGLTLKVVDHNTCRARGKGRLTLRGSESDPLHTIPITSIGDFEYISGPTDWSVFEESILSDGERYLPYIVGRHYDALSDFHVAENLLNHHALPCTARESVQARTFVSS